jgi:hypothetical protein
MVDATSRLADKPEVCFFKLITDCEQAVRQLITLIARLHVQASSWYLLNPRATTLLVVMSHKSSFFERPRPQE